MKQRIVKPHKREEEVLQTRLAALLDAYALPDICWFAVPNGGKRPKRVAIALKKQGVKKGVGDLIVIKQARAHCVELKTEQGSQSDSQEEWQALFERAGGIYHIAFGLQEALAVLKSIGVFRPGIKFTSEATAAA